MANRKPKSVSINKLLKVKKPLKPTLNLGNIKPLVKNSNVDKGKQALKLLNSVISTNLQGIAKDKFIKESNRIKKQLNLMTYYKLNVKRVNKKISNTLDDIVELSRLVNNKLGKGNFVFQKDQKSKLNLVVYDTDKDKIQKFSGKRYTIDKLKKEMNERVDMDNIPDTWFELDDNEIAQQLDFNAFNVLEEYTQDSAFQNWWNSKNKQSQEEKLDHIKPYLSQRGFQTDISDKELIELIDEMTGNGFSRTLAQRGE